MATLYSDHNLYFRMAPVDPTNWDLGLKALQYKQGQYDTNKLKVDTLVQQYLSTDIIKPEAKQRFADNIRGLINEVNAAGQTDFSDPNITNRIMSHIGQALDEPTLNAISISKQFRNNEAFLQELQQKKPELYSSINHQDMYNRKQTNGQSFNDWISDGNATSVFQGQLKYTPFVDVDKKVNDMVLSLMKQNGNTEIEIPAPQFEGDTRTRKVKISGLDKNQLKSIVQYGLSTEDYQQLSVNSRAKYNWYSTPQDIERLQQDANNYTQGQLNIVDSNISDLEIRLAQTSESDSNYSTLAYDLQTEKINKENYTKLDQNLKTALTQNQFDAAAFQVYSSEFENSTVNRFLPLYRETFLGYGVDAYAKDKRDFDFNVSKEKQRQFERTQDAETKRLEQQALQQGQILTIDNPNELESFDAYNNIQTENNKLAETAVNTSRQYINELQTIIDNPSSTEIDRLTEASLLTSSYRLKIQADLVSKHGLNRANQMMSGKDLNTLMQDYDPNASLFAMVIDSVGGTALKTAISQDGTTNYANIIKTSSSNYNYANAELQRLENEAKKVLEGEFGIQSLNAISNGNYEGFVTYEDGTTKVVNLKTLLSNDDVLDANGRPKPGKSLSDSKYRNQVERSFLAGQIMRDPAILIRNGEYPSGQRDKIERLAMSFGEPNAILQNTTGTTMWGEDIGNVFSSVEPVVVDPNSKTGKYLQFVKDNYRDNRLFWQPDVSLAGDGAFASTYYGNKDFRDTEVWKTGVKRIHGNLPSSKTLSVDSKSSEGNTLVRLINSQSDAGGAKANPDNPIIIQKSGDNEYQLFQQVTTKEGTATQPMGKFSKQIIQQNVPSLSQRINWEQQKVIYDREATYNRPIKSKPIKYWTEYTPTRNANEVLGGDVTLTAMLKAPSAIAYLGTNFPDVTLMTNEVDPQLPQKLQNAINSSSRYTIQAKIENDGLGDVGVMELYDTQKRKVVYRKEERGIDRLDDIKPMIDQTPQVLYTQMLQDIITENYRSNISNQMFQVTKQPIYTEAYQAIFNTQQ